MDTLRQSTNRAADTPEGRLQATFERMDRELAMCVGHRLFTILLVQEDRQSLVRAYSSRPDAYPAGGKKRLDGSPWAELVLKRRLPFLGRTADDIRWAFPDHELLFSLGCEAVLNVPVVARGETLGTINLLNESRGYDEHHIALVAPFALLLAEKLSSSPSI